jgi:hypothetical protein
VLSDQTVVVDFTVDSKDDGLVGVGQGLGAGLCWGLVKLRSCRTGRLQEQIARKLRLTNTDNAETLMAKDGVVADDVAAPIGATMANLLGKPKSGRLEFLDVGMTVASEDAAHGCFCCFKKRSRSVVAGLTKAIGSQTGKMKKTVKREGREKKERISSVVVVVVVVAVVVTEWWLF